LLEELRARLASETDVHRISVTRPPENISLQERFVQVQLENGSEELIIVIIDIVNVYVVGYLSGSTLLPTLYYLDDIPREELLQAFPSTDYTHSRLGFSGYYGSLPDRDRIELGHVALNYTIINLYYGRSQPSTLLVIIQMVAEAVRIRYIEHLILQNMYANLNFIPDSRAISLDNRWSDLSQQIQWSAIRMPVPVADEQCPDGEPTTNIVRRDGQCVNVKDSQYYNGNFIILGACGNAQRNQLRTFKSDGTIRSNGKCLTSGYGSWGAYIMIFDCDIVPEAATKKFLYNA
nr:ribosome-inactivating protein [Tanacetum cinerariifolium]